MCLGFQRLPELVSESISQPAMSVCEGRWMLKQVQHDELDLEAAQ